MAWRALLVYKLADSKGLIPTAEPVLSPWNIHWAHITAAGLAVGALAHILVRRQGSLSPKQQLSVFALASLAGSVTIRYMSRHGKRALPQILLCAVLPLLLLRKHR